MAKTKLELTNTELDSILSIISTIEATIGCSDGENDFDTQMKKDIKIFDKMLKKNGYSRK